MGGGGKIPKRFPLGQDAVKIIQSELEERLAEAERLSAVSSRSDYL